LRDFAAEAIKSETLWFFDPGLTAGTARDGFHARDFA
jgi:hypothetical protein